MKPSISPPVSRQWISIVILTVSIPVYANLCWPAISRRGFPEIDPLWLAMRWLWIVPITLSGFFDGGTRLRKWSVGIYSVLSAFFFGGTFISMVPHQVSVVGMFVATVFFWGPINLFLGFAAERASQSLFRLLRIRENANLNAAAKTRAIRAGAVIVVILGLAAGFPLAYRVIAFYAARSTAQFDAEHDWANGHAIWFVGRDEPEAFGASEECYSVENGLKVERVRPGATAAIYCNAYRRVVARKLAQHGPTDKVKDLCTREELQAWISGGRFQPVKTFPLRQGSAEITLKGYNVSGNNNVACFRGEPSKFLYSAIISEKKNALVAITDDSIWIFAKTGELLQSIDFETYRQMGITENVLFTHH